MVLPTVWWGFTSLGTFAADWKRPAWYLMSLSQLQWFCTQLTPTLIQDKLLSAETEKETLLCTYIKHTPYESEKPASTFATLNYTAGDDRAHCLHGDSILPRVLMNASLWFLVHCINISAHLFSNITSHVLWNIQCTGIYSKLFEIPVNWSYL